MSAIKGKDTKPEILLRKALFKRGFRFRIHRKDLPGKPDIVLPKYHAAIFVQGCFWHGHEGCPMFRMPSTRTEFWKEKIQSNKKRDEKNQTMLSKDGWRVLEVWECSMKGSGRMEPNELIDSISEWIRSNILHSRIEGKNCKTAPAKHRL